MKLIIAILCIFSTSIVRAQTTTITNLCPSLQQYEGEWKYQNGTEEIKIYLRYIRTLAKGSDYGTYTDYLADNLIGWVEYKVDGVVIESNYQNRFMFLSTDWHLIPHNSVSLHLSASTTPGQTCGSGQVYGAITDYNHHSQGKNVKAIFSATGQSLDWTQSHKEGYGAFNGDYGMTLPEHFVLTKQ